MTPRPVQTLSLALLTIAIAAVSYAAGPDPAVLSYKLPADLKWNDNIAYPGLKNAVLYGDPSKPGPYAVRNKFSPGAFSRPHFHPNDRYILVLSGTWWVGTGDKFDPDSTTPMPAARSTTTARRTRSASSSSTATARAPRHALAGADATSPPWPPPNPSRGSRRASASR